MLFTGSLTLCCIAFPDLGAALHSLVFDGDDFDHGTWLRRSSLQPAAEAGHDEKWLQRLLFAKPDLVPLAAVTPGTFGYVPICRELSIPKVGGTVYLDIFGVSAEGRLVLVECKLWRNPQARREVIAQILEYASLLRQWSYADLTARLKVALGWSGPNPLYEHARKAFPQLEEAIFVDGVSRSLALGDFALIIAGDGIRSDVHAIATHLNQSSGLASRLALVEFQLWEDGKGQTVVVPSVPLRTEVIEHRIIVSPDGLPVLLDTEQNSHEDAEAVVDPKADAQKDAKRRFWQRFIDTVQFDHPDQPKPRHGGTGWVRMPLPPPADSMTAYRTREGAAGLFFRLKGEEGRKALAAIQEALPDLEDRLGLPLALEEDHAATTFSATVSMLYPGHAEEDEALLNWLCKTSNTAVNTFRPFLHQLGNE